MEENMEVHHKYNVLRIPPVSGARSYKKV